MKSLYTLRLECISLYNILFLSLQELEYYDLEAKPKVDNQASTWGAALSTSLP